MKKFIIKTLFYLIPFCFFYGAYKVSSPRFSGDIGALGMISFGYEYVDNMEKNFPPDNLTVDTVITSSDKLQIADASKVYVIGDSFSKQRISGYQNYLARLLGFKVININTSNPSTLSAENPFGLSARLLNSGYLDSSNCRILILESVDRDIIYYLKNIENEFERTYQLPDTKHHNKKDANKNSELYNVLSFMRLKIDYDNPIYKRELKREYFTHNYFSKTLFHYKDDMNFLKTLKADMEKTKENLIRLNQKFSDNGIKLIILIAADKYDVYRPFMVDDTLPVDTTTNRLSDISGVCVIDTKLMLQKMVQKGEKDVYMVNDTHWSYKASEAVASKLADVIDSLGISVSPYLN